MGITRTGRTSRVTGLAAAVVVVMFSGAACGPGQSERAQGSAASSTTQVSSPVHLAPTSTATPLTDDQLEAWVATLPEGSPPDIATLSGQPGGYLLVDRGRRVPLPADAFQMFASRTPHGLVARLLATEQAAAYTDDYIVSYLFLLDPSGRLVQIAHALMGGTATDPSGRYVAWFEAGRRETDSHTVHVVDLSTQRELTRFAEPARSSLFGWVDAGILIVKGGGFSVRSLDGREVAHPQPLLGAAANRVLLREAGCLHVLDLGTGFRSPPFGCTVVRTFASGQVSGSENVESFVALSPDGKWMIVDGLSVAVDTLTVRGRLMPAGLERQHPAFFPLDATHLWGKIKNDFNQTYVALVCDLPAASCQKVPEPTVGSMW